MFAATARNRSRSSRFDVIDSSGSEATAADHFDVRAPEIQTIIKREGDDTPISPRKLIFLSLNGFTVSRMIPKTPKGRCGVINGRGCSSRAVFSLRIP